MLLYTIHCIVIWELSSVIISFLHNSIQPPEMEMNPPKMAFGCPCGGCPCGGVIKKWSCMHAVLSPYGMHLPMDVSYWVTPGWPQSVQLGNATATTKPFTQWCALVPDISDWLVDSLKCLITYCRRWTNVQFCLLWSVFVSYNVCTLDPHSSSEDNGCHNSLLWLGVRVRLLWHHVCFSLVSSVVTWEAFNEKFLLSGKVLIKTKRCDVDTDRVAWSDSLCIPIYPLVMLILIGCLVI